MRYLFFGLVALSMTVSGCKSKKEQIIELNNKLTIINDSLYVQVLPQKIFLQ